MNAEPSEKGTTGRSDSGDALGARVLVRFIAVILLFPAVLFLTTGTLMWA